MNKLTNEQKESIINAYGSSNETVEIVEEILNVYSFTEEQYVYLTAEIVSAIETNKLNKELGSLNTCESIGEIVINVIKYKLKDTLDIKSSYSENLNNVYEDIKNEVKKI